MEPTTSPCPPPTKNRNLSAAKTAKQDEFYTQLADIESEVRHYESHFPGKSVYLNCDDPAWSAFYQFFVTNYARLGLAGLVVTHYAPEGGAYKVELRSAADAQAALAHFHAGTVPEDLITPLEGDGDFRSAECSDLLERADLVVTNPPFSLFREYLAQLVEHGKQFLIIGNMNAITYKEAFTLIRDGRMWLGKTSPKRFLAGAWGPDAPIKEFGNIKWFTNLAVDRTADEIALTQTLADGRAQGLYPTYDNYAAIEVSRVKNIPADYYGVMGVPITFLDRHNPAQFEVVWQASGNTRASAPTEILEELSYVKHPEDRGGCGVVSGRRVYSRILIRRRASAA